MQLGNDPQENAETLFVENDPESNSKTLDSLVSRAEKLTKELLAATEGQLLEGNPDALGGTLAAAREALAQCRTARKELSEASEQHKHLCETWGEIQKRRKFLTELRTAVLEVRRLNNIAKTIDHANNKRDHDAMSKACVVFEYLNVKDGKRLDDTYVCLRGVSERVSLAVAESMQTLRKSLTAVCNDFRASEYRKCMKSFKDLGAISHFPSYVLQVFSDEAMKIYQESITREGRASTKVIAFSIDLRDLLSQFSKLILFHVNNPSDFDESQDEEELRKGVANSFRSKQLPFRRFTELAARLIDEYRFSLIPERTTSLLKVCDSFHSLCETAIAAGDMLFERGNSEPSFRSKQKQAVHHEGSAANGERITLRRARSGSKLEEILLSSESSRSERRAWQSEIRGPVSKALKAVANGSLSTSHARHAEELLVITKAPECWMRIHMSEDGIRQMLRDVLGGTERRIRRALERNRGGTSEKPYMNLEEGLLETNPNVWTLTTVAIALLRWTSEYVTIGITEPGALSESLSNATDLFLMFLHSSIDMKSRVRLPQAETWLKSVEDVLLERPRAKTIADFIAPDTYAMFRTFTNRYSSSQELQSGEDHVEPERWGCEHNLKLPHFRDAMGIIFSNAFTSHEAIVRQCVAAEGIATLCVVMQKFSECVEHLVSSDQGLSESYEVQRMASLQASLVLGKSVRKAFYELLAWDIVGGWDAISAVAETYRSFHYHSHRHPDITASDHSAFIDTIVERIQCCYLDEGIPPIAAEEMGMVVCSTAMNVLLDGFACVRRSGFAAAVSQALLDVRTLEIELVELTGIHPCPGRLRAEMYVKATFLKGQDLDTWIKQHRRRLNLSERHIRALQYDDEELEVPVVDQIITP